MLISETFDQSDLTRPVTESEKYFEHRCSIICKNRISSNFVSISQISFPIGRIEGFLSRIPYNAKKFYLEHRDRSQFRGYFSADLRRSGDVEYRYDARATSHFRTPCIYVRSSSLYYGATVSGYIPSRNSASR